MSLDFNFSGMIKRIGQEEYDRITDHPTEPKRWHPVTDALIWATMGVGLGEITEKNVDTFYERLAALQAISGGDILHSDGRILITRKDVENHIGLVTNVSYRSDAEFRKQLMEVAVREFQCKERVQNRSAYEEIAERIAHQKAFAEPAQKA